MQLNEYINGERGRPGRLAATVGVNVVLIRQWASRVRGVPPLHCAAIEAATGRLVRRWELRPEDWHRIWPELIGTEGAPPISASAPAAQEAA